MDSSRWKQVQAIFHEALEHPREERPELVGRLCHNDTEVLTAVNRMLDEHENDGSFLDDGVSTFARELINGSGVAIKSARFGPYRLKRLLGEGGMGVVWLAEREDLGSHAAIKILRDAALSPSRRLLFAREEQTLAQLNHPSIAKLFDANTLSDGTPYFVMEYVEGQNLAEYCRQRGASIDEILKLFRQACESVQYAHSQAIIHRDLKPSNILVKEDGSIKLLDFGIAKRIVDLQEQPIQAKTLPWLMTPAYAAPEQIRGEPAGTQCDVYSLGVVLYELLTGSLPYNLSNQRPGEAERVLEDQEAMAPSVVAKANSSHLRINQADWKELDILCLKAISKSTRRRYASVEALIRDLDHYLRREPLEARPDGTLYRAGKFIRRHRVAVVETAVISALMILVIVFFTMRLAIARARTLEEAARTQRIQNLMLGLFDGGDREAGPSSKLLAVSLLDRGAREARAIRDDPQTQTELYETLATSYQKLGRFDSAQPLLESALELEKTERGYSGRARASTMVALGMLRIDQAKLNDGEQLIRDALVWDRKELPLDDPQTARAMSALGRALIQRGSYKEAVNLLDQAAEVQSKHSGEASALADTLSELAEVHYYLGHYAIAEDLNRRTMAVNNQIYGSTHPRIADSLVNLGEIQHDLGHDAEAQKFYSQALEIKKDWYGEIHPDTATCMAAVGQSLVYQGKYDEAAPLLKRALDIQEQVYGAMHPQVAIALNQLGVLELRRKNFKLALADFTRMADINRATYGPSHYLVGVALINIAEAYFEDNKLSEAESNFRKSLQLFSQQLPAGHPNIAVAQVKLGKTLVLEHRYGEAETYLLSGYAVLSKMSPPPAERIESTLKDLVTAYDGLHDSEKADRYRVELGRAVNSAVAKNTN